MGTGASARLVSDLVILCFIFTLWQLGSEFKYQSIAQPLPDEEGKAETLPQEEESAFKQIAYELGLKLFGGSINCTERSFGITCDCNDTICHITEIALIDSGLNGVIPEELANLAHLESLNLEKNQLTGSIPASLGNLSSLHNLDLSNNQLTGPIPASLGNLKFKAKKIRGPPPPVDCKIDPTSRSCYRYGDGQIPRMSRIQRLTLDLSSNQLSGPIPATLGNLAILSGNTDNVTLDLVLSNNQLTGFIPESLGNLSFVRYMDLSYNQLTGPIPESLGNLSLVRYLYISNNQLIGSIPESLGNLTSDRIYIDLHDNFLTGSIPASLGALTSLVGLYLTNNGISDTLPQTLGNLTNLEYLYVGYNNITGTLPKKFSRLTSLNGFSVAGNYLSGPIPDFIGANWTYIYYLYLNGNNFHGKIPDGVFNLSRLSILTISDVGADSHFPFPQSMTTNFRILILRNCSITGEIPSYIGNMASLRSLDLSFNNLTGRIPDSLKNLNLSLMSFSNNNLSGNIPDWIQNAVWSKMDLSYNNFAKPSFETSSNLDLNLFSCCCNSSTCLPNMTDPTTEKYCLRGKPNYHSLFINCGGGETFNGVDGNVYDRDNDTSQFYLSPKGNWARSSTGNPIDLDYAPNSSKFLRAVRCGPFSEAVLYNNARTSSVSLKYYGFCLREGKYSVTLHFAEIVDDANDYRSTEKRLFDIYIQGERKLKDFNIIDMAGGPNKEYQENFTAVNVKGNTLEIHFYSAGKGLDQGPLISAISVTPEYKLRKRLSPLHIALISVASIIVFVLLLLLFGWMMGWLGNKDHLQDIDIGLEKPVTLKQLIDATRNFSKRNEIGKGAFGTVYKAEVQGKIVAVKKLSSHSEERIIQLKNEFYNLKSMSHENLVQLLDVYNAKGLHLLIYEYMQKNSLAHALFDSKSKLNLHWEARFNICLGIARGLKYLHEHPRLKMVHRDIKSANILLDGNLKAKISDFGLASLYTEDDQFKFIKVEVPQGYMAPEYVRGIVTSKADVYSFGVVILETVSGRTNAGHRRDSQESEFLLDTAYDLQQKGRLVDLVDKTLSTKYDAKQAIIILNLAVKCTSISPTLRPTMSEVVNVLVGYKKIEEICPPALNDSQIAQVDSSVSMEVTSRASTSSNLIKGEDETEHISESTP